MLVLGQSGKSLCWAITVTCLLVESYTELLMRQV